MNAMSELRRSWRRPGHQAAKGEAVERRRYVIDCSSFSRRHRMLPLGSIRGLHLLVKGEVACIGTDRP